MKIYKQLYTGKILVSILLLWFLLTGYSYQASVEEPSGETVITIPDEEIPAILDLIANHISDNYERIITWSAEIDVKLNMLHTGVKAEDIFRKLTLRQGETPEAILQKVEEKITFALDANKGFVYVDNFQEKPSKYFNNIDGADLGSRSGPYRSGPYWSTTIARPDFLLEAKPKSFDRETNKIRQRKAVKKPSRQNQLTGLYEGIDDPRKVFMPGGKPWEHFNKLLKHINKLGKIEFDGYSLKMEEHEKGGITEYKIIEPSIISLERSSPDHYIIITKIFSGQYGFNMIYWEVTSGGGRLMQKFTWEYELVNGAYLPKRVVKKHYGLDGEVALEKENTYVNNKLNQKIPSETFEYTNLKLKDRDIFIDEILNKEYRYKAATKTLEPVRK